MIFAVSSINVGINRRAMVMIMVRSCTGNRSAFKGDMRLSSPSVRAMGVVVSVKNTSVDANNATMRSIMNKALHSPSA